nr:hypothetical protein [Clostridia bacterium]
MRTLTKKLLFTVFAAFLAVSCLYFAATAFSNKRVAEADAAALEAEFTNDGEFEIKKSAWNNTISYIDGATVGGTGAVLQVGHNAGVNTFRLDLSPMKVTVGDIASIVVRIKAANFTLGSDEFRTSSNTGSVWRQYGKTDDLSGWSEYTLNANSMGDFTLNSDGTAGYNDIGIRTNTAALVMYVDSITITLRDTSEMEMQTFSSVFNNASYNSLTRALLTYSGTATWNDSDHGNLQYKVTLKNSSTDATAIYSTLGYTQTNIHWAGQKWINLQLPGTYDTIIIAPGAHFAGIKVPSGTLNWNTTTSKWDWDPDIELVYGTPTLTARTSGLSDNGYGWNHQTGNAAVIKNADYGYTIGVFGSSFTAHSTNLAATKNTTSVSVTFNGVSFYKLYQQDDGYRLNAQLGHFGFSVPTAALVGSNGYEVPTIEIHKGTPFYEQYLPAARIIYTDGAWKFTTPVNYDLDFVSINESWNNNNDGYFIVQFDTYEWAQAATPTTYSGITYNGNDISDLVTSIKFFGTSSVWFSYTVQANNPKLVANYNGYSHPTIAIEEGATMEYNGHTFTFHAVTFYLNLSTNKWQTTVPDGYYDHLDEATFSGVWGGADGYNSSTTLLLKYTTDATWDYTNKGDLASYITYRNSSTSATFSPTDSNLTGWSGQKWIILSGLSGYDVIEIAEGGTFGGAISIPAGTFYLVNGRWVDTAPHAANATFTNIHATWNNYAAGNSTSGTILTYNVNPLGDAASTTNQAATLNRTSLMVKYNGSTFFDLYSDTTNENRTKYKISYEHNYGFFYFAIPEADLVGGATLEVEDGTPFMNYYLGSITLVYNATSGKWQLPVNYNPSFVSINSGYNNDSHGYFIVQFNTNGWAQNGVPTSYTGITYNGNDISDLASIKFFQEHSVWFTYTVQASNPKLAANYNGYSHPTIAFAEGATMVYGGETYTFHAVTFYLNLSTNKWQTAVPDGYYDHLDEATFSSVWAGADGYNSSTTLLLKYTTTATWDHTNKGDLASYITYRNSTTGATFSPTDSNLTGWNGQKWIILSGLSGYDVIEIAAGGTFGGAISIPAGTFYLVNGRWVDTAPHAANATFTNINTTWNNYAA